MYVCMDSRDLCRRWLSCVCMYVCMLIDVRFVHDIIQCVKKSVRWGEIFFLSIFLLVPSWFWLNEWMEREGGKSQLDRVVNGPLGSISTLYHTPTWGLPIKMHVCVRPQWGFWVVREVAYLYTVYTQLLNPLRSILITFFFLSFFLSLRQPPPLSPSPPKCESIAVKIMFVWSTINVCVYIYIQSILFFLRLRFVVPNTGPGLNLPSELKRLRGRRAGGFVLFIYLFSFLPLWSRWSGSKVFLFFSYLCDGDLCRVMDLEKKK